MSDDWRIRGQINYLRRKKLLKMEYPTTLRDHEHCEFCWAKFGMGGDQGQGYCTEEQHYWICEQCFRDFQKVFEWELTY